MSALLPCGLKAAEVDEMARAAYAEQGLVDEWDHLVPHIKARWRRSIIAAWNQRATPAEVAALRAEVERLRGAVRSIANQKLQTEMQEDEYPIADFHGAYGAIVEVARAALTPKEPGNEG